MRDFAANIRIVFVIWTLRGMGGSERVVFDIARKLHKRHYTVLVVSFEDGPVRKIYEQLGIRVRVIRKAKRIDFRFLYELRRTFKEEGIEIIHAHHFSPILYAFVASRLSRIKFVYTEHSRWQLEELTSLKRMINHFILKNSDAVVAVSRQIEDYYRNQTALKKEKIHFISNGIDLEVFGRVNNGAFRKELGIGPNERIVGMVANLRPEKNHKCLILAFSLVAKNVANARLVLVGLDCMDGKIQQFAEACGVMEKTIFLGPRNDVPDLLGSFDIFCLPSVHEGLPLALLEAMLAGVPVVGSDVVGIKEIIADRENGILFPANDHQRLAEIILMLLRDAGLRKSLSDAGRSFAQRDYSLDDKINAYDRMYRKICQADGKACS